MNVLSIGNSFSEDAQRYLHGIAKADGVEINSFNLFIGGCSLERHHRNMVSEEREYTLEMNGQSTGFNVSLKEALLNREWDVVTIQQVSHDSPRYETYQPYLNSVVEYVKNCLPKAKIVIHQTWAYEQGGELLSNLGYCDYRDMLCNVKKAYTAAAQSIGADCIIPSGELFSALLENGIEKVHRDTFHASLGLGRYALGLLWYKFLTGKDVENNTFNCFDEEIPSEQLALAKKCVAELADRYGAGGLY